MPSKIVSQAIQGVVVILLTSCGSIDDSRRGTLALPRQRSEWGLVSAARSCEPAADDDVCLRCEKESCCAEVEACGATCQSLYAQYQQCLYPYGGAWSGFGSEACKQRLPAGAPSLAEALALIDCLGASCSTADTCAVEPRAGFSNPPVVANRDFSAANFLESYCSGCHFDGFLGPTGMPTSALSRDQTWWAPHNNPDWFALMNYEKAVEKSPAIRCGVTKDYFPSECATLPTVPDGFFTGPAKFPPSGHGMYSGLPNPCRWTPDGSCPQPTDFERARLLSWLADGAPL